MSGSGSAIPTHRATLKDVARLAGVSQSTTSRAMSGEGYVAEAVRQRVLAVADELGYVPHAMARSLRKQVNRSIGVLVSNLRNTFYADLAAGIASRARSQGYTMMLVDDEGLADVELGAAEAFVATRAAGVIVTPLSALVSTYLLKQNIPVVEVDRQFSAGRCDGVIIDNADIAKRMTDHLVDLGHTHIALLFDETNWTTGAERFAGYQRSLDESGIAADPSLVVSAGWGADDARKATVNMLARRDHPTAVIAANNVLAEGVWRAASDLGLRIPDDLSLVSFDDAQWMSMVNPGITAVSQDAVALGGTAMDRLLDRIEHPHAEAVTVVLDSQILPRGSTAGPRQP
jgi:LacI family transcriptional regulator